MSKKISVLLKSPKTLIIVWMLFLLSPSINLIKLFLMRSFKLDDFHILGLSSMLFYLPIFASAIAVFEFLIWFKNYISKPNNILSRNIVYLVSILSFLSFIFYQYLLLLEQNNYPNFLYSHYGLTVVQARFISFAALLQVVTFMIYQGTNKGRLVALDKTKKFLKEKNSFSMSSFRKTTLILFILGISCSIIMSISTLLDWSGMVSESKDDFSKKVGLDYIYIQQLSSVTRPDIKVIHPPQGDKWPAIGNQPLIRYFLFPRILISGALVDKQSFANNIREAYFIEINIGSSNHWPIIDSKKMTVVFDEINTIKYKQLKAVYSNNESGSVVYNIIF